MASVKQIQVSFGCAEPERLARFWCEVLGYVVQPPPEGFATCGDFDRALPPEDQGSWFACIDSSGAGPRLFFQRVPDTTTTGFLPGPDRVQQTARASQASDCAPGGAKNRRSAAWLRTHNCPMFAACASGHSHGIQPTLA